ncbi:MAG: HAD family phosphatase [Hungatella sp.]|nr:HAD family phosphatase [Hungatella sp.]
MDYKIIVLDLDGTLTNRDKVITPRTREALMRAQDMGKIVVLASGRPTPGVMPLAEELRLSEHGGYILSFNGGMIVSCSTGKVVFDCQLPPEVNSQVIDLAREHRVDIMTYEGDRIIASDASYKYIALESRVCHMDVKEIREPEDMKAYVTFPVPKFILTDDGDYLVTVEPRVKAALGKNYSVYRSDSYYLEVLPRGIDKAKSLERFLEVTGYRREEMIACGDGYNDLSMIKYAGLGVAMENGVLPVRQAADYITLSNNDDGVAHVVEKFMLSL